MNSRRLFRPVLAAAAALALAGGALTVAAPASAAPAPVNGAVLFWGVSNESVRASADGVTCHFLSAGAAGNSGGGVWDAADGAAHFRSTAGDVSVVKPDADGAFVPSTFENRCLGRNGVKVTSASAAGTETSGVFSNGSGTVDVAANSATIAWTGSLTSAWYGGSGGYWTMTDPALTVTPDGRGEVTATVSGYRADRNDANVWVQVPAQDDVTITTLTGVAVTADGFEVVAPDYRGVEVDVPAPGQARTGADWGAFPQDLVDFLREVGIGEFYYSTGGVFDAYKPARPLSVGYGDNPVTPRVSTGTVLTATPSGRVVAGNPITLTAAVRPAVAGTVTFKDGSRTLGAVPASGGAAALTTTALAATPHSLTASFVPVNAATHTGSTSSQLLLTVTKATSSTKVKLAKKKIKVGKKPVVNVTVALAGTPLKAAGSVSVKVGKATRTAKLNAAGKAKVKLPKQKKVGKKKISATFAGSAVATSSTAKTVKLTVKKK